MKKDIQIQTYQHLKMESSVQIKILRKLLGLDEVNDELYRDTICILSKINMDKHYVVVEVYDNNGDITVIIHLEIDEDNYNIFINDKCIMEKAEPRMPQKITDMKDICYEGPIDGLLKYLISF